jgi:adenylate cyclase
VGDVLVTPVGSLPGVLVHAAALQTLLDRSSPAGWPVVAFAIAALVFILITLAAYRLAPAAFAAVTAAVIASAWAASYLCLRGVPSVWIDPMGTTIAAFTACGARLFWQCIASRRALSRFVAPEVAQELAATGRLAARHEGEREATVLFADIRNYTNLAEELSPAEALEILNGYFTWMDQVIETHGGRVDKHIGDAMMAVFTSRGDEHAGRAVAAAATLLRGRPAAGVDRIQFGIGIHTGTVATGELGGEKFEYAAIGDAVNVAARLESKTKELGVPVLISSATVERLHTEVSLQALGQLELKGKSEPVTVYTLAAAV